MPERLRLSRAKGFRLPPGAMSVARPGRFGNPFRIGDPLSFPFDEAFGPVVRDRAHAVEIFKTYARVTSGYALLVRRDLASKDLACWCPPPADGEPDVCHAAVLLAIANPVHARPPEGSGVTPCCGESPFDLPRTDRITEDPEQVTCGGHAN